MKQVQEALKGIGIPVMAGVWRATSREPEPARAVCRVLHDHHRGVTSGRLRHILPHLIYLNLWSDIDPTEMANRIRTAMYGYGFAMVEESDKGYNQPAYDTATSQFTVQWTWCWREEVERLAP